MSDQEPRRCRAAAISVSTSCAYVVPSTRSVRPMMVWMCLGAMRPSRRHSATRGSRSRSATARVRMPSPAPWLTDRTAEMRAAQCVVSECDGAGQDAFSGALADGQDRRDAGGAVRRRVHSAVIGHLVRSDESSV
ncbi:hypothetical protein ASG56_02315 [Rhodococcus sp. Leaf7]|nr:hypothetical protein ASG56_02315 [Rhodococcus sp. Leaf7]